MGRHRTRIRNAIKTIIWDRYLNLWMETNHNPSTIANDVQSNQSALFVYHLFRFSASQQRLYADGLVDASSI